MSEDLQHLLEHIQREGVDKAKSEADRIVEKAREEARTIIDAARREAETLRKQGQSEAEAFDARARESIRQAGRDLTLSLEQAISSRLERILDAEVAKTLDADALRELVVAAVKAHLGDADASVEVLLPPEQVEALRGHLLGALRDAAGREQIEIQADERLAAGFTLRLDNGRIEHDYGAEAIAASLAALVRPGLATLLRDDTDA